MDKPAIDPRMLNHDNYVKTLQLFAKKSNKYEVLSIWGDTVFKREVVELLARTFPAETGITMLGIGSGTGEMDVKMAGILKSRFATVHNTAVEPIAKHLELYQSLIDIQKEGLRGVQFDLRQETLEEYRSKQQAAGSETKKYHFISAVHSMYHIHDQADVIGYLYDCLEEGGVLLIIIVSDMSGFVWLQSRLNPHTLTHAPGTHVCSQHIREGFAAHSIPFSEHRQSSRIDVTECLDPDSEEGKLLIDFIFPDGSISSVKFRDAVNSAISSDASAVHIEDGKVLVTNEWDALITHKSPSDRV